LNNRDGTRWSVKSKYEFFLNHAKEKTNLQTGLLPPHPYPAPLSLAGPEVELPTWETPEGPQHFAAVSLRAWAGALAKPPSSAHLPTTEKRGHLWSTFRWNSCGPGLKFSSCLCLLESKFLLGNVTLEARRALSLLAFSHVAILSCCGTL
jgi:hypothetical protein